MGTANWILLIIVLMLGVVGLASEAILSLEKSKYKICTEYAKQSDPRERKYNELTEVDNICLKVLNDPHLGE